MTGLVLASHKPQRSRKPDFAPLRALLDFLLEGACGTARIREGEAFALLSDLAAAAADLASGNQPRVVVRLCAEPEPWEIGFERVGRDVLVSLFQGGANPDVALHERRLDGELFAARLLAAIDLFSPSTSRPRPAARAALTDPQPAARLATAAQGAVLDIRTDGADAGLALTRAALVASLPFGQGPVCTELEAVWVERAGDAPIVIAADVMLRSTPAPATTPASVLRADLFALLFRGRLLVTFGDHTRELPDVFVFLFAEQLAALAFGVLEAWMHRRSFHRRITAGGAICGVRLADDGSASLTLGTTRKGPADRADTSTFPAVDVGAFVRGVVAFGRALSRSLVRHDRRQGSNLRLLDLRTKLRELSDRLRDATQDDSRINTAPERYRAFAQALGPVEPAPDSFGHARLRFDARWFATVPGLDLRATFLCGDALLLGTTREMCCLDRRTGELVWSRPVRRALSVLTPAGLARMEPDGTLMLHDTATGRVIWTARLSPRVGASASGAVVSGPGLPRMLVASEGSRHLAAIDLDTTEVRWRYATRRGGVFRVRRAGKLLIVGNGEPALSALDVLSGEVIWRLCDPLGFSSHVAVDHDALFALAGDGAATGRGTARLHHLDPWSGAVRWSVPVPATASSLGATLLGPETVIVTTHGRRGTCLVGFDRATGAVRFDLAVCQTAAATLVVDDTIILNSAGGELIAIDAADGQTRYRHVFAGGHESDRPRRLDPLLRSGALFVPQNELHMVRPRDGTLLGRVPADLVPDVFRVDERCHVYVVEESGHLAAFTTAPRLRLVK